MVPFGLSNDSASLRRRVAAVQEVYLEYCDFQPLLLFHRDLSAYWPSMQLVVIIVPLYFTFIVAFNLTNK